MVTCVRKRAATRTQAPAGILLKRNSSTPTTRVVGSCRVVHACYIGRMQKPYSIDDPRFRTRSVVNASERFLDATQEAHSAAIAFAAATVRAATLDTPAEWEAANVAEATFRRTRATQIFALGMLAEMASILREGGE